MKAESTEDLRSKLANFYAQRTLTKSPITLADQAEMAYLLSSSKFSKTTGQIISVDGGFMRRSAIVNTLLNTKDTESTKG